MDVVPTNPRPIETCIRPHDERREGYGAYNFGGGHDHEAEVHVLVRGVVSGEYFSYVLATFVDYYEATD